MPPENGVAADSHVPQTGTLSSVSTTPSPTEATAISAEAPNGAASTVAVQSPERRNPGRAILKRSASGRVIGPRTSQPAAEVPPPPPETVSPAPPRDYTANLIYPGLYAPSGFDMMSILVSLSTTSSSNIPITTPYHIFSPLPHLYHLIPHLSPTTTPLPSRLIPHFPSHAPTHNLIPPLHLPPPSTTTTHSTRTLQLTLPHTPNPQPHTTPPPPTTHSNSPPQVAVALRPNPRIPLGPIDASCALLLCDAAKADHPILYCSEAFERLTGYAAADILGLNCRFLQSPDGAVQPGVRRTHVSDAAVFALKQRLYALEEAQTTLVNYRKGGERFVNLLTTVPVRWGGGGREGREGRVYIVGFLADVGR
ncbi:blue light receptor [Xylographa opegraphella]|nr:blue light receptor [Xylographa opegraphella]